MCSLATQLKEMNLFARIAIQFDILLLLNEDRCKRDDDEQDKKMKK